MVDIKPEIGEKEFESLLNYKYETGGYSSLDNMMYVFWGWLAKFIPKVSFTQNFSFRK